MIKTVFFDLGNTIVDYHCGPLSDREKAVLGLWRMHTWLKNQNLEVTFDQLNNDFYEPWMAKFPQRKTREAEINVIEILSSFLPLSKKQLEELLMEFHEPSARLAICKSDIGMCLTELKRKGVRIGIISNSPLPDNCHLRTLENLGLIDYFSYFYFSYDVGIRKPSPKLFEYALRESNTTPEECIMVGDNFELDVAPAKITGMHAFWFNENSTATDECQKELKIEKFMEILEKLQ